MPNSLQPDDSQHNLLRSLLRLVGPMLVGVGLLLIIIAMVSFFSAFGGMEPPRYFWCAFVGMPVLAVGLAISRFAYLGAFARYMADEVAPVGRDAANYMVDGTKDSLRDMAAAVGDGFRSGSGHVPASEEATPEVKVRCQKCRALNDEAAKFCNQCGAPL
ncbi:MAG TPA: zinc ribbon domain-containing protein [Pirellulales bacterium]|jgi:hypothetical protein|nr:zinc ribbon domain-containing protein [Pirellulales bacterium]